MAEDSSVKKKSDDFMGIDKSDLTLGLSATALAVAVAVGIKIFQDMQRTGQIPNFLPNPQLLAQQQQAALDAQIAAQAQQDAQTAAAEPAPEIDEEEDAAVLEAQAEEGIRTVPRRRGNSYDRINI